MTGSLPSAQLCDVRWKQAGGRESGLAWLGRGMEGFIGKRLEQHLEK